MIKRLQIQMVKWFDYLLFEWFNLFMPEWLESELDALLICTAIEDQPEEIMPVYVELEKYADDNIKTYSVLKNNKLFFDFNPN